MNEPITGPKAVRWFGFASAVAGVVWMVANVAITAEASSGRLDVAEPKIEYLGTQSALQNQRLTDQEDDLDYIRDRLDEVHAILLEERDPAVPHP